MKHRYHSDDTFNGHIIDTIPRNLVLRSYSGGRVSLESRGVFTHPRAVNCEGFKNALQIFRHNDIQEDLCSVPSVVSKQ